jgi:NAD(P)H-hydrate epimerase
MLGSKATVAVVCGPGNNGGDGFVIARVLRSHGVDAIAYVTVDRSKLKGDAKAHFDVLERSGGVIFSIATPAELEARRDAIAQSDLAVDALFGIGLDRPVAGHEAAVIAAINRAPQRLAVDVPSGLHTDTGKTLGVAVEAHRTVTMAALKPVLVSSPGFAQCGDITVCDIGVPPALINATHAGLVEQADVERWLPAISLLDHKGRRGHLVVVSGQPEMRGAGRLAADAGLRTGAGLVTLVGTGAITAADSVMTKELRHPAELAGFLEGKSAVVVGPGLGTGSMALAMVTQVLATGVPAVLDADALNLISETPTLLASAAGPIVITPHPGEAARLLDRTTQEIEADRLGAARALAAQTRAVVVLKGARTITCDGTLGDEYCAINSTGGPALATAGSGDVLSGAIGALIAQGCSPVDAARAAVYVHGLAGDELAKVHGVRGVVSSDLPAALAATIHAIVS